jgi:hypothetical protein
MAGGLVALLDDVAALTKLAAASLDDVAGAASKAGAKAAGVVIDDTAVTPRYVTGLSPERELPIIWKIARGSLRNKLLFLLPAALLLSAFAPWAVTPILMAGGAYLCFEGAEKVIELIFPHGHAAAVEIDQDPARIEDEKVSGAIRTDFILSAEIMAIALADVADRTLTTQAIVLAVVAVAITVGVYGVVGLIVKMDDIGLHFAKGGVGVLRGIGRALVKGMPLLLTALSVIGTAAMIWVGGGIIVHGLAEFGIKGPEHVIHDIAVAAGGGSIVEWLITAAGSGLFGLLVGSAVAAVVLLVHRVRGTAR